MSTTEITAENFESHVTKEGILLLDVWAPWCGPCRTFAPIFEAAAEKHTDLIWGKLNSEDQTQLAEAFQIRSIPTLMVFRDGVLLFREAGLMPEQALHDLVQQARELDMDEVHREVEAAREGDTAAAPE